MSLPNAKVIEHTQHNVPYLNSGETYTLPARVRGGVYDRIEYQWSIREKTTRWYTAHQPSLGTWDSRTIQQPTFTAAFLEERSPLLVMWVDVTVYGDGVNAKAGTRDFQAGYVCAPFKIRESTKAKIRQGKAWRSRIYYGSTKINKVYAGSTLILNES